MKGTIMGDNIAKGQELAKKAENKLHACCSLFGSNLEDAAQLFHKSATSFKLAKSWDMAASLFVKSSKCHMKLDNKHDAANAYVDAAHCYKKTSTPEIGRHIMAAKYSKVLFVVEYTHTQVQGPNLDKIVGTCLFVLFPRDDNFFHEIGELYELNQDVEHARSYYQRAAELFEIGDAATSVIQCKLKVAQFSAQLQQYQKAIEIYEDVARQSLNSNLLKYGVRGHLLNAGLCQLGQGDFVAITNSLERYQDLDPTFSRTHEYKFLADLAASIDEEDVEKFTRIVKEFNIITPLDSWKSTLLSRVKDALKVKEMEEDDLT